jgi:hypothetical protein
MEYLFTLEVIALIIKGIVLVLESSVGKKELNNFHKYRCKSKCKYFEGKVNGNLL